MPDASLPQARKALQGLYLRRVPADRFVSPEFARRMTELSHETGRQIGVLIDLHLVPDYRWRSLPARA